MTTLAQHPLSAAFPAMSAEDFQALKDDIENNGQREPVMVHEGMVLDGWHRYRACLDLGIKPKQFTFDANDDPAAFVESANLHRRHLTASQRAVAVVAVRAWHPVGRQKNVETISTLAKGKDLAKAAQVTPRTITDAKVVVSAGLKDVVRDGGMTVNEAAQVVRGTAAKKPKPQAKAPPAAAEEFGPDQAEIAAAQRAQEEEIAALMKLAAADDKLAAAMDEAKRLRALNRVLQERNNGLMEEKNVLVKRVESLNRKVDKLEKAGAVA